MVELYSHFGPRGQPAQTDAPFVPTLTPSPPALDPIVTDPEGVLGVDAELPAEVGQRRRQPCSLPWIN